MVAVVVVVPPFVAVNIGNEPPLPLAGSPMPVLLFVQLIMALVTLVVKFTEPEGTIVPEQKNWFAGMVTVAVGLTVIKNVLGNPRHSSASKPGSPSPLVSLIGVTVIVAVDAWVLTLVALKAGKPVALPPLAGKPIDGSVLVQLNHWPEPGMLVVKLRLPAGTAVPLQ